MATISSETFGQRVRRLREKQGIRQIDLAARAGISWRHLIRIEQDRGGATKPATIARLADALSVAADDLSGEADDEEPHRVGSIDDLLRLRVRELMDEERASA